MQQVIIRSTLRRGPKSQARRRAALKRQFGRVRGSQRGEIPVEAPELGNFLSRNGNMAFTAGVRETQFDGATVWPRRNDAQRRRLRTNALDVERIRLQRK